jgi:hypothetical protein
VGEGVDAAEKQSRAVLDEGTVVFAKSVPGEKDSGCFGCRECDGDYEYRQHHPVQGTLGTDRAGSSGESERKQEAQGRDLGSPGRTHLDSEVDLCENEQAQGGDDAERSLDRFWRTDRVVFQVAW